MEKLDASKRIHLSRDHCRSAGANLARPAEAKENRSVTYRVKGFTCVTCAVGLEVMLRQQKRRHAGERQLSRKTKL